MDSEDRFTHIIKLSETVLSNKFIKNVNLRFIESLESQFIVLRLRAENLFDKAVCTIIVKHIPMNSEDKTKNTSYENRFLNELASLEFLLSLTTKPLLCPELLGYDLAQQIIILDDKGKVPSVEDVLKSGDRDQAINALKEYSFLLARLHGLTKEKSRQLYYYQEKFRSKTPKSDSTVDIRNYSTEYKEFMYYASQNPQEEYNAFSTALNSVEEEIQTNKLQSFIHCDTGPQNFLFLYNHCVLLDYEFGGYGFSLLDIIGPRIAYQQTMDGQRIPNTIITMIEDIYFTEINKYIDLTRSEFTHMLVLSHIHWVLNRLGNFLRNYLLKIINNGITYEKELPLSVEQKENNKSKIFTLLFLLEETYKQFVGDKRILILTTYAQTVIHNFWPDIKMLPYFKAFRDLKT